MNRVLAACCLSISILISGSAQRRPARHPAPTPQTTIDGWITFHSESGRFSVLLPELPNDKTETITDENGVYKAHRYSVRGEKSVFVVGWVDYDPTFDLYPTHELDSNLESFVKGVNGTLVSSKKLTIDGYPSIEFTAETEDTVFKSRVYIVGRRPYQLATKTAKGLDDSISINRFFESFKVTLQ